MTPQQLQILQHSLGMDKYGRRERYETRKHFVTHPECDDGQVCESLVALGLMKNYGPQGELTGGMTLYRVTDAGINAALNESPAPPKRTRSQQRYDEFLSSGAGDCYEFGEWLKLRHGKQRA